MTSIVTETADCVEWMDRVENRQRFDVIVADPPYNIGQNYAEYTDKKSSLDFDAFIDDVFRGFMLCIKPGGSLWWVVPDELVEVSLASASRRLFKRWSWCIWHYRFGQHQPTRFIRSKTHLFWFFQERKEAADSPSPVIRQLARCPRYLNPDAVLVESDRRRTYGDKRIQKSPRGGLRMPLDVWEFSRVQGTNAERWNPDVHPNQLPEAMVARMLKVSTRPGDVVLDPFLGSGTTGVVAKELGMNFAGIDVSEMCVESARARIERGVVRKIA